MSTLLMADQLAEPALSFVEGLRQGLSILLSVQPGVGRQASALIGIDVPTAC